MALRTFLHDLRYHVRLYNIQQPWEQVGYAVRCLKGDPKRDWISFAAKQQQAGKDPLATSLDDLEKFLENQLSDPTTCAITGATKLSHIVQVTNESVMGFVRRYQEAEMESPDQPSEQDRVNDIISRFRTDIRIAISSQTLLPTSWADTIGLARRIEAAQGISTLSTTRAYAAYTQPRNGPTLATR